MSTAETSPCLLTSEVMAKLRLKKPDDVYRLGKEGRLKSVRLRRQHRWLRESVEQFLRGEEPKPRQLRAVKKVSAYGPSPAELAKLKQVEGHFG